MARRPDTSERTCVVTREAQPPAGLIRFALAPDGTVVPDLRETLPGRGVWVTGRRDLVETAVKRKLFTRGFKTDAAADAALPDLVDRLLHERALSALSMARKAGRVVTGFGKVSSAIARDPVIAVIHATEAAGDGRRKIAQVMRRRLRLETDAGVDDDWDDPDEDLDDDLDDIDPVPAGTVAAGGGRAPPVRDDTDAPVDSGAALPRVLTGLFDGADLDLALGGSNVIHAALLAGGASTSFLKHAAALARYRGGVPDTDWIADAGRSEDRRISATRQVIGSAPDGPASMADED